MNIRVFVVSLTLTAVAASVSPVSAYTYQQVFSFCDQFEKCTIGTGPSGGVIEDAAGNLYGTDFFGGTPDSNGTVYELTASGKHGALKYKNLHSFCECAKGGRHPEGYLVGDTSGNFFGLTYYGGTKVGGTFYEISPNDDSKKYSYRTLYNFCDGDGCGGSAALNSSLAYEASGNNQPYDGVSPLYTTGITDVANRHIDCGKVFQLLPNPGHKFWQRRTIHDFGNEQSNDGCYPQGRLIFDSKGDIFGTTISVNGLYTGDGTVYELTPNAKRTKWTLTILHVFCPQHDGHETCPDGAQPNGVTFDTNGNLVGTTFAGGTGGGNADCDLYGDGEPNCGVLFKLTHSGQNWSYSVMYNFCSLADCADGHAPLSIPTVDAGNNVIGAVSSFSPATFRNGAIFELTSGGTESLLHVFCPDDVCGGDGSGPGDLFLDASGNLFGTTGQGGPSNGGTVFELTP